MQWHRKELHELQLELKASQHKASQLQKENSEVTRENELLTTTNHNIFTDLVTSKKRKPTADEVMPKADRHMQTAHQAALDCGVENGREFTKLVERQQQQALEHRQTVPNRKYEKNANGAIYQAPDAFPEDAEQDSGEVLAIADQALQHAKNATGPNRPSDRKHNRSMKPPLFQQGDKLCKKCGEIKKWGQKLIKERSFIERFLMDAIQDIEYEGQWTKKMEHRHTMRSAHVRNVQQQEQELKENYAQRLHDDYNASLAKQQYLEAQLAGQTIPPDGVADVTQRPYEGEHPPQQPHYDQHSEPHYPGHVDHQDQYPPYADQEGANPDSAYMDQPQDWEPVQLEDVKHLEDEKAQSFGFKVARTGELFGVSIRILPRLCKSAFTDLGDADGLAHIFRVVRTIAKVRTSSRGPKPRDRIQQLPETTSTSTHHRTITVTKVRIRLS